MVTGAVGLVLLQGPLEPVPMEENRGSRGGERIKVNVSPGNALGLPALSGF